MNIPKTPNNLSFDDLQAYVTFIIEGFIENIKKGNSWTCPAPDGSWCYKTICGLCSGLSQKPQQERIEELTLRLKNRFPPTRKIKEI